MNRQTIISLTGCRECDAPKGEPCERDDGKTANHAQRLYDAQDITLGKPAFRDGTPNPYSADGELICRQCNRTFRTPEGKAQHDRDKHGETQTYRNAAVLLHSDPFRITFDENARVRVQPEKGAWVQAWVFVSDRQLSG